MPDDDRLIDRRDALKRLAAAWMAGRAFQAPAAPVAFAALDHIEFYVSNVEKSRDFLAQVFGAELKNRSGKRYLKLGASYMAFETTRANGAPARVQHVSASVQNLDMPKLHALLESRGVEYRDYPSGRDTGVNDPDGARIQLSPENGWSILNPANFPAERVDLKEPPVFRPTGLDHILLNVTDPQRSIAFYEKIFGPASPGNNNRVWFQVGPSRIGLLKTPEGERAGVNHFCVAAEAFDYDDVMRRLETMGAKIEKSEVAGAPEFRDPDGLLIQVQKAR